MLDQDDDRTVRAGYRSESFNEDLQDISGNSVAQTKSKAVRNLDLDWRPIPGYVNYEISEFGDIWNVKFQRPLKIHINKKVGNYRHVCISAGGIAATRSIHNLVASIFLAPSTDPRHDCVLHWDDDPSNNHFSNLRWGSAQDNADDRKRNGATHAPYVRLTPEMVAQIHASDLSTYALARQFGCSHMAIHYARTGKRHRHLHPSYRKVILDTNCGDSICDGDGDHPV